MKPEELFDGVTDIRDDLIEQANKPKRTHWLKRRWPGIVAAVLVLAVLWGTLRPSDGLSAYALAEPSYPKMAPYPNGEEYRKFEAWWEDVLAQRRDLGDITPLQQFFGRSAQVMLSGSEGENRVYSPLNVYMALAMLARLTDGQSRQQILELLGSESMEALQQQAGDIWNSNYQDDGALTSILSSSLWLNQQVSYNRDTIQSLARDFYASSYQGEMGSEQFNQALQSWLDQQTQGLLQPSVQLDPNTVLALATTVSFHAKWFYEFSPDKTKPQLFHSPTEDVEAQFMHQRDDQSYYWADHFSAISQSFDQAGSLWLLLPDEGITPEQLLSDQQALDFLFTADKNRWEDQKYLFVNKSIPKFDVSSQFDLNKGLQQLGVRDVFDPELSDFSPMTQQQIPISLSQVNHAARVIIDEEGCTAVAYTVMEASGAAPPPDNEVDFVADRPFLFCITGINGLPLFVGIVNYPNA